MGNSQLEGESSSDCEPEWDDEWFTTNKVISGDICSIGITPVVNRQPLRICKKFKEGNKIASDSKMKQNLK